MEITPVNSRNCANPVCRQDDAQRIMEKNTSGIPKIVQENISTPIWPFYQLLISTGINKFLPLYMKSHMKRKTAADVQRVCEKIQLSITARTGNKLLTWQCDRGTELLNGTFEGWLKRELGVIQRFSNIEHPWENGMVSNPFHSCSLPSQTR